MDPSTLLRGPGLLRIGELVEPSINGPFDFAQGACLFALRDPGVVLKISFVDRIKIFPGMSA